MPDKPNCLVAALAAVQADLPRIAKEQTARIESGKGSYSYRYADLTEITSVVMPLLAVNGLAWTTCPTVTTDGRFVLRYALRHTSGEEVVGDYPLPKAESTPQVLGSAITYARRYALCAVTGVAPGGDDDDAAEAQRRQPEPEPAERADRSARLDSATDTLPEDPARAWRKRLAALLEHQGRTPAQGEQEYHQWSQGGDIRTAEPDSLRDFHRYLREEKRDVWDTGEPSPSEPT